MTTQDIFFLTGSAASAIVTVALVVVLYRTGNLVNELRETTRYANRSAARLETILAAIERRVLRLSLTAIFHRLMRTRHAENEEEAPRTGRRPSGKKRDSV